MDPLGAVVFVIFFILVVVAIVAPRYIKEESSSGSFDE